MPGHFLRYCITRLVAILLVSLALDNVAVTGQGSDHDTELIRRITSYVERVLFFAHPTDISVISISPPDASGLRRVLVRVSAERESRMLGYWITPDAKEIFDGQVNQLSEDPWANTRARLQVQDAPQKGAATASVTLVEFSDLACAPCKQSNAVVDEMLRKGQSLRVVFKYFPLEGLHPWALDAALAATCVAVVGQAPFWAFADAVFARQAEFDSLSRRTVYWRLRDLALHAGIHSANSFDACDESSSARKRVTESIRNGAEVGVTSVPTLFVNGRMFVGYMPADRLQAIVAHAAAIVPRPVRRSPPPPLSLRSNCGSSCAGSLPFAK